MKNHRRNSPSAWLRRALVLGLLTVCAVMMTVTAGAAEVDISGAATGVTVDNTNPEPGIVKLRYTETATSSKLQANTQYVIMVLAGDTTNLAENPENILYIDQQEATPSGDNVILSFDLYPSQIKDSNIYIFGRMSDNTTQLFGGKIIGLNGDIDGDDDVDIVDATRLIEYYTNQKPIAHNIQYLDFDGNGTANKDDAKYLLKHALLPALYELKNLPN